MMPFKKKILYFCKSIPTNHKNDNSHYYTGNEKSSKETNGTRNKVDLSVSSVTCS